MNNFPELIVMLTHNDYTIANAYDVFDKCKDSKANFWGLKEKGLPLEQLKELFSYMKQCGKTPVLEVVSYTEKEGLDGAKLALECGCDILMGTKFFDSINDFCREANLKYMPFIGDISGRPTVLNGTPEEMISEAKKYIRKGVYGIDLLGYRFTGNSFKLNEQVISAINVPICIAGSIDSYEKLDEIKTLNPWAFTVGSAIFENHFNGDYCQQINTIYDYITKIKA